MSTSAKAQSVMKSSQKYHFGLNWMVLNLQGSWFYSEVGGRFTKPAFSRQLLLDGAGGGDGSAQGMVTTNCSRALQRLHHEC